MTEQHLVVQADVTRTVWACSELEYALGLMLCMPSQHHAIGLQTDCMVVVPAPVVRIPDSHVYAFWPRLGVATPVVIIMEAHLLCMRPRLQ